MKRLRKKSRARLVKQSQEQFSKGRANRNAPIHGYSGPRLYVTSPLTVASASPNAADTLVRTPTGACRRSAAAWSLRIQISHQSRCRYSDGSSARCWHSTLQAHARRRRSRDWPKADRSPDRAAGTRAVAEPLAATAWHLRSAPRSRRPWRRTAEAIQDTRRRDAAGRVAVVVLARATGRTGPAGQAAPAGAAAAAAPLAPADQPAGAGTAPPGRPRPPAAVGPRLAYRQHFSVRAASPVQPWQGAALAQPAPVVQRQARKQLSPVRAVSTALMGLEPPPGPPAAV